MTRKENGITGVSMLERADGDPQFERFLEDSERESDQGKFSDFDSAKVTRVLKVYLSKKESRVVTKCQLQRDTEMKDQIPPTKQVPIYLLRECRSDVFIDFMKKLIYQAMSPEIKAQTYKQKTESRKQE